MLAACLQRGDLVLQRIRPLEGVGSEPPPAGAVLSLQGELVHPVELVLNVLHLLADPVIYSVEIIVFRVDVIEADGILGCFVALLRAKPANAASSLY